MVDVSGQPVLTVHWRQGAVVHGRVVKIGGDVASTLQEFASDCAAGLRTDAPSYDPDEPPEEEDPQRVASLDEAFDTELLQSLSRGGSHPSATGEDLHRRIICWALIFGVDDERTVFVHKNNPVQLASKPLIAGLFDDALARLTEPLFAFDAHFDLVIANEQMIILDYSDFEVLFRESEAVLARAREWSEALTSQLPSTPASTEALEVVVRRNGVIRRKVTSIIRRPYFNALTPSVVREKLEAHGLDADTYMPGGELDFNADTIQDLVRFLNEDLFEGDFSNQPYAASGKQRLGTPS
ncbi:Kiwa anti-phage protein KwaB-like domain-containing protein [Herbiconiux sp.]|uniref:Kiwa anti-phage protein KwaB-like domain-containing protein n=1 Tax=Herbiconiux sp. TaxID=1871186 RepID=UPI0025BCB395|nr:Kiwa anti-phage protein KwaB-like domain-containing protein [Herbiconiux sp.]